MNTILSYKLFRTKKRCPGELFSLFINKSEPIWIGEWLQALSVPTVGYLFRPGWHSNLVPIAPHLMKRDRRTMQPNRVWAEIEIPMDGYYELDMKKHYGGVWIISNAMKVKRLLNAQEVQEIIEKGGSLRFSKRCIGTVDATILQRSDNFNELFRRYNEHTDADERVAVC